MERADLTRPLQVQSWPSVGRAHPRKDGIHLQAVQDSGSCPSSLRPEATRLRSSPVCLWRLPSYCSARAQGECPEPVHLCAGALRGRLHFQLPSVSPRRPESPLIFAANFCGDASSWHWRSGLGPLASPWRPPQPGAPPDAQPSHVAVGPTVSHLCPSPQSDGASSLCPQLQRFCSARPQLVLGSTVA